MFWKIYSWFVFVVLVLDIGLRIFVSYSFLETYLPVHTFLVALFIACICLLGLFGYVYKKKIFFSGFWKAFLVIAVISQLYDIYSDIQFTYGMDPDDFDLWDAIKRIKF